MENEVQNHKFKIESRLSNDSVHRKAELHD